MQPRKQIQEVLPRREQGLATIIGVKARSGQRVFLKHIRSGRRLMTTQAWLDEFHADLIREDHAGLATGAPVHPKPQHQRHTAVVDAQSELAGGGDLTALDIPKKSPVPL